MIQSIYSGVSSLQSFQTGIDVLANNIANVNTTGFRGSRTEFANLFEEAISQTSSITSAQTGLGVRVSATALDLTTGSYSQTENTTDLAISGNDGWFGIVGGANSDAYYTRAGNFNFEPYNSDGYQEHPFFPYGESANTTVRLANVEGFFVTGTLANNTANGVLSPVVDTLDLDLADVGVQEALIFPAKLTYPVEPSTQADFLGNLGLENIPQSISATVISPQSERNNLRLLFTQSAVQPATGVSWDVTATTQNADGSTIYDTQTGLVSFNESGSLISSTLGNIDNDGAPININLGTNYSGLVSHTGPSVVTSVTIDGTLAGDLTGYTVNRNGEIISNFTNGKQSVVGKVAIYHFQNDQGLEAASGTKFRVSDNSGPAIFYAQNNGTILINTLETSNVQLETALTELIIMQRSYDAASKTISTADQLLQNALNMGA
ncbi:MAG TPA: flagellar hook protein FlgE [Sulfurimonas sp.]|nr:flagellar hook protein FlgE [Sulfurimonas sp.]